MFHVKHFHFQRVRSKILRNVERYEKGIDFPFSVWYNTNIIVGKSSLADEKNEIEYTGKDDE